ncbi:MAG TPA: hypothetical protein VN749_08570 [Candidatus Eisenbacteria bacterium]|jgi:hypothetical protein|nr:hypothetical protein [Candidatus Eisenbacteria bacterium]
MIFNTWAYLSMTPYESAAFEATRRLPMLAERGAVWASSNCSAATLGGGVPAEARNQFGRVADFTLLEAKSREEIRTSLRGCFPSRTQCGHCGNYPRSTGTTNAGGFYRHAAPPRHVETFYDTPAWKAYQRHIEQLLAAQNVAYLDASRWIPDGSKFGDPLHLTPLGAEEFSRPLGARCSNPGNLSACSSTEK